MGLRRLIVEVDTSTVNVTEFCRVHGLSTWSFWNVRRRYAVEGEAALLAKSRAPHRIANKTDPAIEDLIVAMRKELVDAGLDAGPASIGFHLRHLPGLPSEATIWRILRLRGFIAANPSKAPKSKGRRFVAARANECWQLDDTNWELANGTPVKILDIIDDHSRVAVASTALASCTGAAALGVLSDAAAILGWPERILSDNAKAFRDVLANAVAPLGVAARHTRPYHPQTNGKVERFHQTLKKWLRQQPQAETLEDLQHQLDCFRGIYNHHRPHRSLDRQFPATVWEQAPKSGPADRPLGSPTSVYRGTVINGRLTVGHSYQVSLGAAHNNQPALAVVTGTACHVFIDGRLIRHLALDPTRRVQPIHPRPGRPTRLP